MPNPFLRSGPAKSSKEPTDRERPTGAISPVPEGASSTVFAYRGQQTHGVPTKTPTVGVSDNEWQDAADYDADYADPERDVEPIPVRIVLDESREIRQFRVVRQPSGTSDGMARNLLGRDPTRKKVVLKNVSPDTVYIGHDQQTASSMHGWPLAQNESFETESAYTEVWAQSSTAAVCVLAMKIDYVTAVKHD